jgi:RNA polymerase sigma-70 factor (ECF subfamily)
MAESDVRKQLPGLLARLWRYGVTLTGSRERAEDLVQATAVRALEREGQFTPGTRLDHWLFSIERSIWFNTLRAERVRQGQGLVDASEALTLDGAHEIETNISARQVLASVGRLPEAQRETVFLVYVEGYSYKEAAETLGVPIGTVMSRLAAARGALTRAPSARADARLKS